MKRFLLMMTVLALLLSVGLTASAAGTVTDTLTVKIGYWGMDTDSYVTVGTYHWSELEANLPLYYEAYSFYRAGTDGDYVTVIDSAYGFGIADLISYAGIYAGDVQSLQFYTQDQTVGYFTSFTYGELFGTARYYFSDLAAHIHPVYDEEGNFTEWDATEAWDFCTTVQPMLALEDNWAQYEIGTEHTEPDYSNLGTGNRFRLLFGQSYPLEMRTNQTAKYTHTVYVTLSGCPTLGEIPALDGTIGSHTFTTTLTVGNAALVDAIGSLLNITSSDESVLRIDAVEITPNAEYSDLVDVKISYEILKEGEATISAAIGEQEIGGSQPVTAVLPPDEPEPTQPTEATAPTEATDASGQTETSADSATTASEPKAAETEKTQQSASDDAADGAAGALKTAGVEVILLDASLAAQLRQKPEEQTPPQESVMALTLPAQEPSLMGAYTAIGAVLLILLGGTGAFVYYKKER